MTGAEARKLTDEQLAAEVSSLKGKLYSLRSQMTTEKVEDVSQFKKIRADIARLLGESTSRRHAKSGSRAPASSGAPVAKKAAKPAATKPKTPRVAKPAKVAGAAAASKPARSAKKSA